MKSWSKSVASILLVSLTIATTAITSAGAAPSAGVKPIFLVKTGDQTWGEALTEMAQSDPTNGDVKKVLELWKTQSKGEPHSVSSASIKTPMPTASSGFVWSDPNTWKISGEKSSDKWYWKKLKLVVDGAFCVNSCEVTDRITATTTVNPGTVTSMINTTVLYSPNSGNFKTRRWSYVALCSYAICGTGAKIDNGNTVKMTFTGYGNLARQRLTIAVGLSQSTIGRTVQIGAKTADCIGQSDVDRRCKYVD